MPAHAERLSSESYLIRDCARYGDEYSVCVTLSCNDSECEIKGLYKRLNKEQAISVLEACRDVAGERILFATRKNRRVIY